MQMRWKWIRRKWVGQTVVLSLGVLLLLMPLNRIPVMDDAADRYFQQAIKEAGAIYGICRIINAGVSVIKGSDMEIQPAGLGGSLAAGGGAGSD